jgi:hypothetical protein
MQSQRTLAPCHKKGQFTYKVTVTNGQATTPKFTFAAGAPAAVVDWGDGTARDAVTSGTELNHAYTVGGTYTVRLIAPNQAKYLTQIDINNDKLVSMLTPIQMFPKLTLFYGYANLAWVQNISNWTLPTSLSQFMLNGTGLMGIITHWVLPTSLVYFHIGATALAGVVTNWVLPANLGNIYFNLTSLTGVPVLTSMVSIQELRIESTALIQASVDAYLARCVAREAATTYATPILNLGGTNAAPSAQGVTDKNTLVAAGWIVTVTP